MNSQIEQSVVKIESNKSDDVELLCNPQELIDLSIELQQLKIRIDESDKRLEEKEAMNNKISKEKEDLEEKNACLLEENKNLQSQLAKLSLQLSQEQSENDLKQSKILSLQNELNNSIAENKKLKSQNETNINNEEKIIILQDKLNSYETELKRLQLLIDNSSQLIQEQNKINQSLIRKNNDFQMKKEQAEKNNNNNNNNNSMQHSRIESINSIFQQVENYKQQISTLEDFLRNVDIDILLNTLMPKIEEKVNSHNDNKTEYRKLLLREEAKTLCDNLKDFLNGYSIQFNYQL